MMMVTMIIIMTVTSDYDDDLWMCLLTTPFFMCGALMSLPLA